MRHWVKNYGFATLVIAGAMAAAYLAATVAVPNPVPDFALKAREIYRLEVGMAFFVAFYLAAMALVLAFDGRGFAEFGTGGLKVEKVVASSVESQQEVLFRQLRLGRRTRKNFDEVHSDLGSIRGQLEIFDERLERLEERR